MEPVKVIQSMDQIALLPLPDSKNVSNCPSILLLQTSSCSLRFNSNSPCQYKNSSFSPNPTSRSPKGLPNKKFSSLMAAQTNGGSIEKSPCYRLKSSTDFQNQLKFISTKLSNIMEIREKIKFTKPIYTPTKKTVLLGLDNTIILSFKKSKLNKINESAIDLGPPHEDIGIVKRPYLDIFLAMVQKHFAIHVCQLLDIFIIGR